MTPRGHDAAGRLTAVTGRLTENPERLTENPERLTETTGRLTAAHALADRLAPRRGAHPPDGTALHKTRPGCAFNC